MTLANNLIPVKRSNSISETIVSLFLIQPILKPSRFKDLLNRDGIFKEKFQSFKVRQTLSVSGQIKGSNRGIEESNFKSEELIDDGFLFESFNAGEREYIVQSTNGTPLTIISIHLYQYEKWDSFIETVNRIILSLSEFQTGLFIKSVGLSYVDQFDWIGANHLPMTSVFNAESEYIPPMILSSTGDWSYSCGRKVVKNEVEFIEHVNISYRPKATNNYLLTLSHSTVNELDTEILELSQDSISQQIIPKLSIMHDFNKSFLKASLNSSVLTSIGL